MAEECKIQKHTPLPLVLKSWWTTETAHKKFGSLLAVAFFVKTCVLKRAKLGKSWNWEKRNQPSHQWSIHPSCLTIKCCRKTWVRPEAGYTLGRSSIYCKANTEASNYSHSVWVILNSQWIVEEKTEHPKKTPHKHTREHANFTQKGHSQLAGVNPEPCGVDSADHLTTVLPKLRAAHKKCWSISFVKRKAITIIFGW